MQLQLGEDSERSGGLLLGWARLAVGVVRERPLWIALLVGVVAIALAYQSPRPLLVDIGSNLDTPFMVGFHEPEQNGEANYRWSTAKSAIVLPGVGKPLSPSPFAVHLQLSGGPKSAQVGVAVNGHAAPFLELGPVSKAYTVNVDPSWLEPSGDLRIEFASPTFQNKDDRRQLGFLADFARIDRSSGLIVPSLTHLTGLLLCGALLYLLLRAVWLTPRASGWLAASFLVACAGILAVQRLLLTMFTGQMLATLVIALLVAALAEAATRGLVRLAGWRGERRLPEWSWAALRGLVLLSATLKVGGLLYPLTFIIDAPFHLKYVTYMNEVFLYGRSWEQYFGESLAFAVMPKEEWGAARAFIPYSPFFYVVATPLAWLPLPLSVTVPVAGGIMEALKVALVFITGLALGKPAGGQRTGKGPATRVATVAVATATIYSIIPATFLLQQFGNWPTLLSIWLVTAWVAVTALFWESITRPAVWLVSTILLTLTLLSYTVTAVYTGIFVGMLGVLGWMLATRDRKRWTALFASLLGATALSLLIYYGQYMGRIIGDTLPTFEKAAETQGSLSTLRPGLWDFLSNHLGRAFYSYNLALIYVLAFAGALLIFVGRRGASRRKVATANPRTIYAFVARGLPAANRGVRGVEWQRVWTGIWLLTFPLFTLLDFYVDQAFKEFWYALPAVALVAGAWLLTLIGKGRFSRLYTIFACLIAVTLAWQSISLWVFRLLFHNR